MIETVELPDKAVIMTTEEGTVSGLLDIAVDESGAGLVRYRGTDAWLTIGNLDDEPPAVWAAVADLVSAIEDAAGAKDIAGNAIPFET
ncbi:hypothetical protein [Tomitella biformata]|uniref:hypothetical protein n=1 Tax=Tomitella biformata TaxID=630403 RepID=UPI000466D496|nr:hypothetical protein [Tomitella biformata]